MADPNVPPSPGPPTPLSVLDRIPRAPAPGTGILDFMHYLTAQSPYGKRPSSPALGFLESLDPMGLQDKAAAGIRSRADAMKSPPPPAEVIPDNTNAPPPGYRATLTEPPGSDEVLRQVRAYGPYMARGGNIQRVDKTRTDLGLDLVASSAEEGAKAIKDEAYWQTAEKQDLGALAPKREKIIEEGKRGAEERQAATQAKVAKVQEKIDADAEYVRTHGKIDPYRMFQTNAGAGIFAALGSALMATGAGMRRDSSLEWTKQIDKLLEREAEAQIRMLDNKKWAVSEGGQNVKRILETSRDVEEAKARIQAQALGVIAERANAITANAQSEIMKAQGKKAVAALHEKVGEHVVNVAIREQGFESAENQAQLASSTQAQIANVGLLGTLATNQSSAEVNRAKAIYEASKPVQQRLNEIDKGWEDAHAALTFLQQVLHDPKSDAAAKNNAVSAYSTAFQTFMGGTAGTVGARNAQSTFGAPDSFGALMRKLNHQPTVQDLVREGRLLDAAAQEKKNHVKSGKWTGVPIAADSAYTVRK